MTHSAPGSARSLTAQVTAHPAAVEVLLWDPRPDTVQSFEALTVSQREQLARDAWHVGLRALMNAYRQAEEARLQDIGKSLTEDLEEQLRKHAEVQEKAMATALGRYFDPESGELFRQLALSSCKRAPAVPGSPQQRLQRWCPSPADDIQNAAMHVCRR